MFIINGITTDSKTFYIRLHHRKRIIQSGSQIWTPFKDQRYVKILLAFNYTTRPSLTSFALPTGYLLVMLLCSLLRHTPYANFTFLVVRAHPVLDYHFTLSVVPAPPKIKNHSNASIYFSIIIQKCVILSKP